MQPIVLAHGYLGFSKVFGLEYFHGVSECLTQKFGVPVLATMVPPKRTVPERAALLEEQIHEAFGGQPVHVIAHSMGGLDARYLLLAGKAKFAGQIASLTTVSTPHAGTYVADLVVLARNPGALFADVRFHEVFSRMLMLEPQLLAGGFSAALHPGGILNALGRHRSDTVTALRDILAGLAQHNAEPFITYLEGLLGTDTAIEDLTTQSCRTMFGGCNNMGVPWFSYPGRAIPFETLSPLFLLSWIVLSAAEGENDGMVSVLSASCPAPTELLPADHAGVIGWGAGCAPWYESMVRNIQANVPNA